jgi:hypothetical protein
LVLVFCFYFFDARADTTAPTNPTTTTPSTLDLSDGTITNPQYGCPSGTTAAQINNTHWGSETVRFGECVNTFAITYAINQALTGTGVSIDKVHYSWRYVMCFQTPGNGCNTNLGDRVNMNTGEVTDDTYFDELQVVIEVTDSNGNVVETKTWNMDTWYQWNGANLHSDNEIQVGSVYWQIHEDNIEVYNHIFKTGTIRTPNSVGDVRFRINGQDKGNWDGYYGPVINRLQTSFTYRANPCTSDTLYDPSCPGYADAYASQQYDNNCAANALYDTGCPGYATAYHNQQCTNDPLYDSSCSGYATAYYNQQCSANALYDSGCPGYESALYDQSCKADPLYDSGCPGYATAYYNQQCTADALYDSGCPGYATAYYNQQCTADALYDSGCPGYETAYFNQQCTADALYDSGCPGYETAYFNQQCTADPLYNSECSGYDTAYFNQQCGLSALYNSECPGYATAYFTQQCTISGLYDTTCPNYETAFFDNQCTIDSTYNPACPGYAVAIIVEESTPNINDGENTAEDIAEESTEIISVESVTEVAITGDVIVDSIINEEPTVVIEIIEDTTPEAINVAIIEEEIVPVELAVESAFDQTPVVETFNSFADTGPVIAPLASNAQIEQKAEIVELEVLVENIEAEVELEITQLDSNIEEPIIEAEVETTAQLIEEEVEEVAEVEGDVENETTDETVESKEDVESDKSKEETTETTAEEKEDEVVEEPVDEEAVEETETIVAEKPKPKKIKKLTKEEKAEAKAKKMKEIIKLKLASLADDMSKATSLKDQAAIQAKIQALINFVPGFNTYGGQVQIAGEFYGSDSIYTTTKVPENQRGLLNGLASQLLHEAMVDMQYEGLE